MSERKFNARQLTKMGAVRRPEMDFSDDGTRFKMYDYKGILFTYAYDADYVYISATISRQGDFIYDDYKDLEIHKLADEFNGVSDVDIEKLKDNLEKIKVGVEELKVKVSKYVPDFELLERAHESNLDYLRDTVKRVENGELKWWKLSDYELTQAKKYYTYILNSLNSKRDFRKEFNSNPANIRRIESYIKDNFTYDTTGNKFCVHALIDFMNRR